MSHRFRSAFVPHDLPAPIAGAAQGPLAGLTVAVKDMYDIAVLEAAAARADVRKLIVADDAFAEADAEVADLLRAATAAMARDLPAPTHGTVAPDGFDRWRESFRIIQAREIWGAYGPFVEKHRPKLGPGIRERMEFAATVSERDAEMARQEQKRAREHIRALIDHACAADGTEHRPAPRHRRRSARVVSRPRHAADLYCRHERIAASHAAGGFNCGLSGRALLHRLARRR